MGKATQEKVLGAAIFGAGWVAGEHAKAYQACGRTRLVAVGSRKLESAQKCAAYAGAKSISAVSPILKVSRQKKNI